MEDVDLCSINYLHFGAPKARETDPDPTLTQRVLRSRPRAAASPAGQRPPFLHAYSPAASGFPAVSEIGCGGCRCASLRRVARAAGGRRAQRAAGARPGRRAAQVWYCVAPRDRPRLEAMARALFPELAAVCPAFLRHKDLLFSPRLLRAHNIDFVQARGRRSGARAPLGMANSVAITEYRSSVARAGSGRRVVQPQEAGSGGWDMACAAERAGSLSPLCARECLVVVGTARGLLRMDAQPYRCPCCSEPHGASRGASAFSTTPYPTPLYSRPGPAEAARCARRRARSWCSARARTTPYSTLHSCPNPTDAARPAARAPGAPGGGRVCGAQCGRVPLGLQPGLQLRRGGQLCDARLAARRRGRQPLHLLLPGRRRRAVRAPRLRCSRSPAGKAGPVGLRRLLERRERGCLLAASRRLCTDPVTLKALAPQAGHAPV